MTVSKLCLIDANSLFYRAFYAIKAQLMNSRGQPTNAVFGFVRMVKKILGDIQPQYLAVCFDVGRVTHRTQKFAEYKIHRQPMPDGLLSQVPWIKDVVKAYHFPLFECEGYEADDVIATLVRKMKGEVDKIIIVSSDKDILQLVSENVEVYNPYKEEGLIFTPELVRERLGVRPERIPDLLALMGDASDNIPGARGIGEKTARELLASFDDVEDVIRHKDKIPRESVRKIIAERQQDIRLSRELAGLHYEAPLETDLKSLQVKPPDNERLWDLFSQMELRGFLKELSEERLSEPAGRQLAIEKKEAQDAAALLSSVEKKGLFAFALNESDCREQTLKGNIALDEETVWGVTGEDVRRLMALEGCVVVCHDAKSLRHALRRLKIETKVRFFDTMMAAYLLESSRTVAELDNLIWDHLSDKTVSRQDYLGKESHFVLRLHKTLERQLSQKQMEGLFWDLEMPLEDVLFEMESVGIHVDLDFLKDLSARLDKKLSRLVEKIFALAGCEFNINSPKQLADVLFQKLKLTAVKKTKTGFSTDEEVLTRLSADHELPHLLLEFRQISKLKTTYVDALPALRDPKTGRIHTTFNQAGTETGRLSSSAPNLQNIPIKTELGRSIRKAFVPSEGFDEILSADYSQVELRILAHLSGDQALIEAFEKDLDIHRHTASLIFGVQEKDVTEEMRENAKRVNFGIVYGMSPYGLARDLKIDPRTAEAFICEYFLRYPLVKSYLDGQVESVRKNGFVSTILGRRRYIPEIHNANQSIRQFAERQAINAPIQGSAADLIKLAMIDLDGKLRKKGCVSRLVIQVHDELVLELKAEEAKNVKALVKASMEKAMTLKVPLKVSLKSGKNWLDVEEN
ncbi:MAG: DNA polymerase I [Candidatus Omnitrophota bacterium]